MEFANEEPAEFSAGDRASKLRFRSTSEYGALYQALRGARSQSGDSLLSSSFNAAITISASERS